MYVKEEIFEKVSFTNLSFQCEMYVTTEVINIPS